MLNILFYSTPNIGFIFMLNILFYSTPNIALFLYAQYLILFYT